MISGDAKTYALLALIAFAHVAFLFVAYATEFYGLGHLLSLVPAVLVWFGGSSALAGFAYYLASARLAALSTKLLRAIFAVSAASASLFAGLWLTKSFFN